MSKKFNQRKFKPKTKVEVTESELINTVEDVKQKLSELNSEEINHFEDLPLCYRTLRGLDAENFINPTKVQKLTLIHSLGGKDVVAEAKTGSGKTLAFIIPLLENLFHQRWSPHDGLGALIITPTRELAYQINNVINKVGKNHNFSVGLIIGGKDLRHEWVRMGTCNIMICTPGRLLQHMTENPHFNWDNLLMLILDEADQCLSMGFAQTMNTILEGLPSERQTLLFSATQTRDVKDLIRAGCKDPVYCSAHENSSTATPKALKESYVVCEDQDKINFLYSFLKNHSKCKILIFLSTCKQVKYVSEIMHRLRPGITVSWIHGNMHQLRRMKVFDEFCRKQFIVLFATDVAARGLDIPNVDWVVQADCPENVTTYIHRVGRTGRCGKIGEALLLLTSNQEEQMVSNLSAKNIPIEKIEVDSRRMQDVSLKIQSIITKFPELNQDAIRAYRAYLKSYGFVEKNSKAIFDITSVDRKAYAMSLGLSEAPRASPAVEKKLNELLQKKEREDGFKVQTEEIDKTGDWDNLLKSIPCDISNHSRLKESEEKVNLGITQTNRKKIDKDSKGFLYKKTVFDADGNPISHDDVNIHKEVEKEEIEDPTTNLETVSSGISILSMNEAFTIQDTEDKEEYKEKLKKRRRSEKQKEKSEKLAQLQEIRSNRRDQNGSFDDDVQSEAEESDYESELDFQTQEFIDELPDPDKVYGAKQSDEEQSSFDEDSSDDYESPDTSAKTLKKSMALQDNPVKAGKKLSGKRLAKEASRKAKRACLEEQKDLNSLDMNDKEALALYLLKNKR